LTRLGVSYNLHDDLVQEILVKLWKNLQNYDNSKTKFRTWLSNIIRNNVTDYWRKMGTRQRTREGFLNELDELPSETEFDVMIQQEWETYITNLAFEHVQTKFTGNAIDAFKFSMQGLSPDEVGEKLSISGHSVYKLNSRVKKSLTAEIKRLRDELEG